MKEWEGSLNDAMILMHCGWRTPEEKAVYLCADDFLHQLSKSIYSKYVEVERCKECGRPK